MGLNLGCARCKSSSKLGFRSLGTSFLLSYFLLELQYSAVHYVAVCYSGAFKFIAVQECF